MTASDLQPTQRLPVIPEASEEPVEPRHGRGRGVPGFLLRLLLVLLVVAIGLVAAALLITPPRMSVLIMGSDARPDELARGEVGRTDTMMLVVADRAAPRLSMVSVPRDLWVAIPGYGEERINAAYELGGSGTAKQTISNVTGQRVDRAAVVGLQGVRDIVDAAGGVDITVAQRIYDDQYPTDDYGYQVVDIPAGRQHMDGETALKYARTRHQDNDFGRTARQQQVIAAVRTAMLNPINWPRTPAVLAAVTTSIRTDLTPLDAIALGAAALRAGEPDRLVIDTELVRPVTGQDGAYLLEPRPDLKPAVMRFLGSSTSGPSTPVTVQVLNGSSVAGLAARTSDRLAASGYQVAPVGDAPRTQAQTSIVAQRGARSAGDSVAASLGVPTSRVTEGSLPSGITVQVTLGADAR